MQMIALLCYQFFCCYYHHLTVLVSKSVGDDFILLWINQEENIHLKEFILSPTLPAEHRTGQYHSVLVHQQEWEHR